MNKQRRRTQALIKTWEVSRDNDRVMASQYVSAATMLEDQGDTFNASFLYGLAKSFESFALSAETTIAQIRGTS